MRQTSRRLVWAWCFFGELGFRVGYQLLGFERWKLYAETPKPLHAHSHPLGLGRGNYFVFSYLL